MVDVVTAEIVRKTVCNRKNSGMNAGSHSIDADAPTIAKSSPRFIKFEVNNTHTFVASGACVRYAGPRCCSSHT